MHKEKRKFIPDFKAQVAMEACKGLDIVHTLAPSLINHSDNQDPLKPVCPVIKTFFPLYIFLNDINNYFTMAKLSMVLNYCSKVY